jgi:hypothetical protein
MNTSILGAKAQMRVAPVPGDDVYVADTGLRSVQAMPRRAGDMSTKDQPMRTGSLLAAAGAIVVGIVLPAVPALAATSGGTDATITITAGALQITVPAGSANLGTSPDNVGGETISGPLGQVQVLDARDVAAGGGWVASVISTAFTPTGGGPAIAASNVSYVAGTITTVGTATDTANDPTDLTGVSAAVTATAITGDNSATWTPSISVNVPGGMAAATYVATITHSVA